MIGRVQGRVVATRGFLVEAELPFARAGAGVRVHARDGDVAGRVAALHGARATLALFGPSDGIALGDAVTGDAAVLALPPPTSLLGRAVDGAAAPLDGRGSIAGRRIAPQPLALAPTQRVACSEPFWTGVRAIDGPLMFARGARIGLFGGAGCGKSTLLDAIVRGARADAVVLALIGERGREAQQRVANLDARTAIVCATGDRSAAERMRAAEVAFGTAAALRERGLDVLLVVDSLARIAGAAREIAIAAGEPAGRGGYPASTFATVTRLVESAGGTRTGSVTLVATVLGDGPDDADPVSESVRAALDGHIVLSPALARAGRFPAVDLTRSTSRTFASAVDGEHRRAAGALRAAASALDGSHDARSLGLDPAAGDPALARAIAAESAIERFLRQDETPSTPTATLTELRRLADRIDDGHLR